MTTVYFVRHSKPMRPKYLKNSDVFQMRNEKEILSVEGEIRADLLSEIEQLSNLDLVISSNYIRTISTAKYIAKENNLDLYINEDFGERKFGVSEGEIIPDDFYIKQFNDENHKIGNGESSKEVKERIHNALMEVLDNNRGQRIAIVFHGTAMMMLLRTWCEQEFDGTVYKMSFNKKIVFNSKFNAPELFKLVFDDNNKLVDIENIRPEELESEV